MVTINYAFKEVVCKIVYYGPGLSGKTTNLQYVFDKVPAQARGELISLATETDRTLYFDFLPINLGNIQGLATKFQLYTVPGQVFYNATRKLVLRGVDGLVFVADSQLAKLDENMESLKNLKENLSEYGYNFEDIPLVIQYNKSDLPLIAPIEQLQSLLNTNGALYFKAVAVKGIGVFDTLKAICKLVLDKTRQESGESDRAEVEPSIRAEVISHGASGGSPMERNPIKYAECTSFLPEVTIMDHSTCDLQNLDGSKGNSQSAGSDAKFPVNEVLHIIPSDENREELDSESDRTPSEGFMNSDDFDNRSISESKTKSFIPGFEMDMDASGNESSSKNAIANTALEREANDRNLLEDSDDNSRAGKAAIVDSSVSGEEEIRGRFSERDTARIEIPIPAPQANFPEGNGGQFQEFAVDEKGIDSEVPVHPPTLQRPRMQAMAKIKKTNKLSLFAWIKSLGRKSGGD